MFGSGTESAVKYFQRTNGLTADGIIGPATAAKLGIQLANNGQTVAAVRLRKTRRM
ncbi:MAG: peptidoglycan-binding domain-containing protein [Christensenellales bacterium]